MTGTSPSTGSLWRSARRSFQSFQPLALVAGGDHQRAHRLDDVDRARAEAVEVAGHQRVRAAQLAGAALRAVDVVVGHVLDVEEPLLHRDDVRVERGRRVVLVARDLHDRADLAAELVPGGEAAVRRVAPLLDELAYRSPSPFGLVAVVPPVAVHRGLLHRRKRTSAGPSRCATARSSPTSTARFRPRQRRARPRRRSLARHVGGPHPADRRRRPRRRGVARARGARRRGRPAGRADAARGRARSSSAGRSSASAIVSRDDAFALRMALMVRDVSARRRACSSPIFDPTTARAAATGASSTARSPRWPTSSPRRSPGPCLDEDLGAVRRRGRRRRSGCAPTDDRVEEVPVDVPDAGAACGRS